MLTSSINFVNFKKKIKSTFIKKNLNSLLKNKNQVIESLSSNYKNSYKIRQINKYRSFKNFRVIGMGGSTLGTQGVKNSLSIIELLNFLEKKLKIKLNYHKINNRLYDQKIFISDNKKIYKDLKWKPNIDYKKGLDQMLKWIKISKIYKNV